MISFNLSLENLQNKKKKQSAEEAKNVKISRLNGLPSQ